MVQYITIIGSGCDQDRFKLILQNENGNIILLLYTPFGIGWQHSGQTLSYNKYMIDNIIENFNEDGSIDDSIGPWTLKWGDDEWNEDNENQIIYKKLEFVWIKIKNFYLFK